MSLVNLVKKLFGITPITREQIISMNNNLTELKKEVLECDKCPDDYNCCKNLSPKTSLSLIVNEFIDETKYFPKEVIKKLTEEKKLVKDGLNYHMETSCPILSETGCILDKKSKPKPLSCKQFPIFYSVEDSSIILDNRCHSIQQKFEEISEKTKMIAKEYAVPIKVYTYICDNQLREQTFEKISINYFKQLRKETKNYSVNISMQK